MQGKHKLRAERDNCGYTQKVLAERAGLSPSTISNIECRRGPNVPASRRVRTKTKTETGVKIVVALEKLPPGEYDYDLFIRKQSIFSGGEMYEAPKNIAERQRRRNARQRAKRHQHLKLVV